MPTHIQDAAPVRVDLKIVNARLVTPSGVQRGAAAARGGVIVAIGEADGTGTERIVHTRPLGPRPPGSQPAA